MFNLIYALILVFVIPTVAASLATWLTHEKLLSPTNVNRNKIDLVIFLIVFSLAYTSICFLRYKHVRFHIILYSVIIPIIAASVCSLVVYKNVWRNSIKLRRATGIATFVICLLLVDSWLSTHGFFDRIDFILLLALVISLAGAYMIGLFSYRKLFTDGNKYPKLFSTAVFLVSLVLMFFVLGIIIGKIPFER